MKEKGKEEKIFQILSWHKFANEFNMHLMYLFNDTFSKQLVDMLLV